MKKLSIFCCSHFHNEKIEKLSYVIPAGTGKNNYPKNWFSDKEGKNISHLNRNYAELTFHYWIWKNFLDNFSKNDMIGFCQYRRFWLKKNHEEQISYENLNQNLLNENNFEFDESEVFLTKPEKVSLKKKSIFKYRGFLDNLKDPLPIFSNSKHSVGLQFEVYTKTKKFIYDLSKFLKKEDQDDFLNFLHNCKEINLHNMFITNKLIFSDYMKYLFDWLNKCDQKIKEKNFNDKGLTRMHAFLAERFLHFWFNKFHSTKNIPWIFLDTSK